MLLPALTSPEVETVAVFVTLEAAAALTATVMVSDELAPPADFGRHYGQTGGHRLEHHVRRVVEIG